MELLKRTGVKISGKRAVVIGRSNIVGMPVALLLQAEDATVTVIHSRTPQPEVHRTLGMFQPARHWSCVSWQDASLMGGSLLSQIQAWLLHHPVRQEIQAAHESPSKTLSAGWYGARSMHRYQQASHPTGCSRPGLALAADLAAPLVDGMDLFVGPCLPVCIIGKAPLTAQTSLAVDIWLMVEAIAEMPYTHMWMVLPVAQRPCAYTVLRKEQGNSCKGGPPPGCSICRISNAPKNCPAYSACLRL